MADNGCSAMKDFVNARVNFAILKLDEHNAKYKAVCKNQEKAWLETNPILQKLSDNDRRAVLKYYEDEVHKFSLEFNSVYIQGLQDCFRALNCLGVFGGKYDES